MKVVFILGSGHCGATLLDMLLDSHSKIVGVGEMHNALRDRQCTCGKYAFECPVWRNALGAEPWPRREIFRRKWDSLVNRGPYRLVATHQPLDIEEFSNATIAAYKKILAMKGAEILVDSSKEVERVEVLIKTTEIEPLVIHLVRDGRGATWSYVRKYKRLLPFFYLWFFSNIKIELFRHRYEGAFLFLRYEDLVDYPEETLRMLCHKIGVPFEPGMLKFRDKEHHQIEGNRMRFATDDIHRDDTWRREMPRSLRLLFTLCFGWLNAIYIHKRSLS
jgi:hypothetical protein